MPPVLVETSTTARQIIDSGGIITYFQPILSARQRSVIGAEALSRGVIGVEALTRGRFAAIAAGQVIPPAQLFGMAEREGLSSDLEKLCRITAIKTFAALDRHEDLILFVNVDAAMLEREARGLDELAEQVSAHGLNPRNVAIEILESAFEDGDRLKRLLDELRARGFLIVLDDVGTGYSNLDRVPLIKPDILKLDRGLIRGIENDYYRQETFKSLVQLTRRIGSLVVAEGIETEEQAIIALELGADLLQGFFLGRPENAGSLDYTEAAVRIDSLARRYKTHMIQRINDRKLQYRRFNIILNQILCELSKADPGEFDSLLTRILPPYDNVECVYVMDEAGLQVTGTVCNHTVRHRNSGVMFRPAPRGADHSLKEYYYMLLDVELHKYTTDPYVSLATGNLCRTISTCFRDGKNNKVHILCIDVLCE
jgi:EAL domain-containing protein (putative c-di-GMP-specific phosphodiesterase class I)